MFNRVIPVPGKEEDDDYLSTDEALEARVKAVYEVLDNDDNDEYRKQLKELGFRFRYVELINEMIVALDELSLFKECSRKDYMIAILKKNLAKTSSELKVIQEKLDFDNSFKSRDYESLQRQLSFENITREFFDELQEMMSSDISLINSLDKLYVAESDIIQFCNDQDLKLDDVNNDTEPNNSKDMKYISAEILGKNEHDENVVQRKFELMIEKVKQVSDSLIDNPAKVKLIIRGDQQFDTYFKNANLKGELYKPTAIAILDDSSFYDTDLLITRDGVVLVSHNTARSLRGFDKIEYAGKSLKLGWPLEYSNKAVRMDSLYMLMEELKEINSSNK